MWLIGAHHNSHRLREYNLLKGREMPMGVLSMLETVTGIGSDEPLGYGVNMHQQQQQTGKLFELNCLPDSIKKVGKRDVLL